MITLKTIFTYLSFISVIGWLATFCFSNLSKLKLVLAPLFLLICSFNVVWYSFYSDIGSIERWVTLVFSVIGVPLWAYISVREWRLK